MISSQEEENKKLKMLIENLNSDFEKQDMQLKTKQLQNANDLKKAPIPKQTPISEILSDFNFRQNETRQGDLDLEERAIMNLAAQEVD